MTVQSHARVSNLSNLFKRMSLPTNDMPNEKRQRLSRSTTELPRKLCRKRKQTSSTPTRELDTKVKKNCNLVNRRISMFLETRELPEEVIQAEILTRLPVKSIVRFKSVCKSWMSLFSSPGFVREHNAQQNPDDYDCLVADKTNCVVTFSRYQETCALRGKYDLIGSAKGLVCVRHGNIVSLWNPAIHQSKELHLPPQCYDCLIRAGFGFDPVTNEYKVAICYESSLGLAHLTYAVYSSNSDSWSHHKLDDAYYEILTCKYTKSCTPDTMVKDCPYWIRINFVPSHKKKRDEVVQSIQPLKFDATTNKFKLLPNFCSSFGKQNNLKVVNMKDLLTLMSHDPCTTGMLDIYSLNEDKGHGGAWRKMYCLETSQQYSCLKNLQQGFNYGDETVCFEKGRSYLYDHKTDTAKCIPVTKSAPVSNSYFPKPVLTTCFTFTPGLVLLDGMTSIYSESQVPPSDCDSLIPLRLISSLEDKCFASLLDYFSAHACV